MRICFSTRVSQTHPIVINDKQIDIVSHTKLTKILGVKVSSDLKRNHHIAEIVKKASKRLFCFSGGLGSNELVQFYRTCIRPITEYAACPVFHDSLPDVYLSREIAAVQKRAMRIIFPCFSYEEALVKVSHSPCQEQGKSRRITFQENFRKQKTVSSGDYFPLKIPNITTSASHTRCQILPP